MTSKNLYNRRRIDDKPAEAISKVLGLPCDPGFRDIFRQKTRFYHTVVRDYRYSGRLVDVLDIRTA